MLTGSEIKVVGHFYGKFWCRPIFTNQSVIFFSRRQDLLLDSSRNLNIRHICFLSFFEFSFGQNQLQFKF